LEITGSSAAIDLSNYLDNTDAQDLVLSGNTLSLTNDATSIDLSGYYNSPTADAFFIAQEFYAVDFMLQKFFFNKKLNCRIYVNDIFNTLVYANERPFETFRTTRSDKPRTQRITFWMTYNFSNKQKVNSRKAESKNEVRRRL